MFGKKVGRHAILSWREGLSSHKLFNFGNFFCQFCGESRDNINPFQYVGITDPTNQVIKNRFGSGHIHSDDYRGKSILFAISE